MGWAIHLHIVSAIAWLGGAFFMFLLGVTLRKEEDKEAVYLRIGPIYGYFEIVALVLLLITGYVMISSNGLLDILFSNLSNQTIDALRMKLYIVAIIVVLTIIHTTISMLRIHKKKTRVETLISRGSSMGIFILNLIVLHYAMVLRDVL